MLKNFAFLIFLSLIVISCKTNPPTSPEDTTPTYGTAFISANVSDAEIWLDNNNTGQVTPDTIKTTVGTHTITLKKTDYVDASQIIEIIKDSLISLNVSLIEVSQSGRIFIESNAVGAQIFIDQVNTGKVTPDTIITAPGIHQIELQRAFFYSSSQQIEAFQDSLVTINMFLQEKTPSNVVLLEDFANVSCIPCVTSNRIIHSLLNFRYGYSKLAVIKYPTNFPSPNDPFYLANPGDCSSRISYYNVYYAPTTQIDGILSPYSPDSLAVIAAIDQRLTKELRFRMDVSSSVAGSQYNIVVTVQVLNGGGIDLSDCVLHTVVTETDIEFANPPGSNGETKFYDVMRVMLPSNAGETLSGMSQTEEVTFQWQTNINPSWVISNLNAVAFIQNVSTKEVYQACSTFE